MKVRFTHSYAPVEVRLQQLTSMCATIQVQLLKKLANFCLNKKYLLLMDPNVQMVMLGILFKRMV